MTVQGLTLGHGARTLGTYGGPKRFIGGLIELVKYLKEITPQVHLKTWSQMYGTV